MPIRITTWACTFCKKHYINKQQALNCEAICAQQKRFAFISSLADKLFPVSQKKDHVGVVHCVKCGILLEHDDGFRVLRGLRCVSCREELLRNFPKLLENTDFRDAVVFLLRKQK